MRCARPAPLTWPEVVNCIRQAAPFVQRCVYYVYPAACPTFGCFPLVNFSKVATESSCTGLFVGIHFYFEQMLGSGVADLRG